MIDVLEKEEVKVVGKPTVKRGVLCFIKTEYNWRMHFFSNNRNQDDVPEDYLPLRFPNWTREEAIEKFLDDSTEILNPNQEHQA
jgi:hypothetical protein